MPVQVESDSLQARLLELLMGSEKLTIEEAAKELSVSKERLERVVKKLASRGILRIQELPDKKYLDLVRTDIQFQGVNPSQEDAVKHKKSGKEKKDEDDKGSKKSRSMMYR